MTSKTGGRVIVLDASAFIAGFDPSSIGEEQFTVPMVKEEIRKDSIAWVRFRTAVEGRKLVVKVPKEIFLEKTRISATLVGDTFFLSEADLQVLALALELKTHGYQPLIATDDYSIQNVANQIGVEFASLATFGIRFLFQWVRYCPACHKRYPPNYETRECLVCNTELKRKPLRRRTIDP